MFYYLNFLSSYSDQLSFLRLFKYVTFRAGGAAFTAFILTLLLGPLTIRLLTKLQTTTPPRVEGIFTDEEIGIRKRHVPTMGGILLLFSIVITILLWANPANSLVIVFLALLISLGLVGFVDDYLKVKFQNKDGLAGRWKLLLQFIIGGLAVWCLHLVPETGGNITKLMLPFLKQPIIENTGIIVAVIFGSTVVVASSNAVNLSDGMDGLAIGCTIICALAYACFAYICGHKYLALYLHIPFISGSSEVVVIAVSIVGAGLGFLWHNCCPAAMFMGDTGSLSIGGAIGLIAVLVKQEILLVVIGGIFVIEAGSVILQVAYFKLTRYFTGEAKRMFLCAPIHHHFHKTGWKETQIVIRFWIIAILLAFIGLATLKIR